MYPTVQPVALAMFQIKPKGLWEPSNSVLNSPSFFGSFSTSSGSPIDRADNTRKRLAAHQADELLQGAQQETVLHGLTQEPRHGADKKPPAHRTAAGGYGLPYGIS